MKQRNQVYTLADMEPGDRFYLLNDRKKNVLMLNDIKPFEIKVQKGFKKHYANCRNENAKPGELKVQPHLSTTFAVYLRNINEPQNLPVQ